MANRFAAYADFQSYAKDAKNIAFNSEKGTAISMMLDGITQRMSNYIFKSMNFSLVQAASDGLNSPVENYGTEHYGMHSRNIIRLKRPFNLVAVTSVIDNQTVLDPTYYYVDYQVGVIRRLRGRFFPSFGAVQVIYTAGYPVSGQSDVQAIQVPVDLRNACLDQANFEFSQREPGGVPAGAQTVSRPDGSLVIKPQAWLDKVKDVLDQWRR